MCSWVFVIASIPWGMSLHPWLLTAFPALVNAAVVAPVGVAMIRARNPAMILTHTVSAYSDDFLQFLDNEP